LADKREIDVHECRLHIFLLGLLEDGSFEDSDEFDEAGVGQTVSIEEA
jgi:hypothetical protein